MNLILDRLRREPVILAFALQVVVNLAVAFGLSVDAEALAAVNAPLSALIAVLARGRTTSKVSHEEELAVLANLRANLDAEDDLS